MALFRYEPTKTTVRSEINAIFYMLRLILFSILDNSYYMQGYKKRSKDSGGIG